MAAVVAALLVTSAAGCSGPSGPTPGDASPTAKTITEIPSEAMLQQADLGTGEITTDSSPSFTIPTAACGGSGTGGGYTALRQTFGKYRFSNRTTDEAGNPAFDGEAGELVRAYAPGQATGYVNDLRDHASQCATGHYSGDVGDDTSTYSIVEDDFAGDDSLMWQRTGTLVNMPNQPGVTETNVELVGVVRLDDVVIVLYAFSEDMTGTPTSREWRVDQTQFEHMLAAAVARAAVLRR